MNKEKEKGRRDGSDEKWGSRERKVSQLSGHGSSFDGHKSDLYSEVEEGGGFRILQLCDWTEATPLYVRR